MKTPGWNKMLVCHVLPRQRPRRPREQHILVRLHRDKQRNHLPVCHIRLFRAVEVASLQKNRCDSAAEGVCRGGISGPDLQPRADGRLRERALPRYSRMVDPRACLFTCGTGLTPFVFCPGHRGVFAALAIPRARQHSHTHTHTLVARVHGGADACQAAFEFVRLRVNHHTAVVPYVVHRWRFS